MRSNCFFGEHVCLESLTQRYPLFCAMFHTVTFPPRFLDVSSRFMTVYCRSIREVQVSIHLFKQITNISLHMYCRMQD